MSIFFAQNVADLKDFGTRAEQLAIVPRQAPCGAGKLFNELMQKSFTTAGYVRKAHAVKDIHDIVEICMPQALQCKGAYQDWIEDMAEICEVFCDTQGTDAICFWLGTQRGCRRYHVDNVPMRLLVTYAGKGTEWLLDDVADRDAFAQGAPNEKIVKNASQLKAMQQFDVAVFRGGPQGLLHRTPDAALEGASILMRLDHPSFWDTVLKNHYKKD